MKSYRVKIIYAFLLIGLFGCAPQKPAPKKDTSLVAETTVALQEPEKKWEVDGSKLKFWIWTEKWSSRGQRKTNSLIERNRIVTKFVDNSGRITAFFGRKLMMEVDLEEIGQTPSMLTSEWLFESEKETWKSTDPETEGSIRSLNFDINFRSDFTVTCNVYLPDRLIAKRVFKFQVSEPPSIKIVEPLNDLVVEYGTKVKFTANAIDGIGKFPMVVWVVRSENVERVLGVGSEITTDRLDIGYNTIHAHAIDIMGNVMQSEPLKVLIPYKTVVTKIESPLNQQEFDWNQSIQFYARGNQLEYALTPIKKNGLKTAPKFQSGSGFLKNALPSGAYEVVFKGKFGTVTHQFTIKEKPSDIAEITRVEGYVIMSGKRGVWQRVKAGDKIPENFIVRAVKDALAEIKLSNGVVYILNQGNAIRILSNGNIAKNINKEDLALYSLVDPENIEMVQKNLTPMIGQLQILLNNNEIVELESENRQDVLHSLDLIFKGQLKIDEVIVE